MGDGGRMSVPHPAFPDSERVPLQHCTAMRNTIVLRAPRGDKNKTTSTNWINQTRTERQTTTKDNSNIKVRGIHKTDKTTESTDGGL
jgi:hypothetical protein